MSKGNLPEKKNINYQRIIKAATHDFSEKGFAGARMDAIAARAEVNKATIYYQIGDKKALYSAVLHDVFGGVADQLTQCIQDNRLPEENLTRYVQTLIKTIRENPFVPPIMMREAASRGKHLPFVVIQDFGRIFAALSEILSRGYEAGHFRKINPIILHLTTLGPLVFFSQMENIFQKYADNTEIFHTKIELPENLAETVLENMLNLVKRT